MGSWKPPRPGKNRVPENIIEPGTTSLPGGTLDLPANGSRTVWLSQLGNAFNPGENFFLELSDSNGRLTGATIEQATNANNALDYRITVLTGNQGASSVVLRLPGAEEGDERLISRAILNGTVLNGTEADEWLYGGDRPDTINGNGGDDRIYGGNGNDQLNGGDGDDYLNGGNGNDRLDGGLGSNNRMRGGDGDDYFIVRNSDDQIYEPQRGGFDTIEAHVSFRLSDTSIDDNGRQAGTNNYIDKLILTDDGRATSATGNSANNPIVGNTFANVLSGEGGNDALEGWNGDDILLGGSGNDTLTGGNDADQFAFDSPTEGSDTIKDFQAGTDQIRIYRSSFGDFGNAELSQFSYNQQNGRLSFTNASGQSSVLATLESRPAFQVGRDILLSDTSAFSLSF